MTSEAVEVEPSVLRLVQKHGGVVVTYKLSWRHDSEAWVDYEASVVGQANQFRGVDQESVGWPGTGLVSSASALGAAMKSFFAIVVLLFGFNVDAAVLLGKVVAVSDGDTIVVLDAQNQRHKIRLAGIDAPEKSQPYGQQAKRRLSAAIAGKTVQVEWTKHDRYRRIVGVVRYSQCEGCIRDAGLGLVMDGYAWRYRKYANEQSSEDRQAYEYAERLAKSKRLGLWADRDPIPPWDWRRGHKSLGQGSG